MSIFGHVCEIHTELLDNEAISLNQISLCSMTIAPGMYCCIRVLSKCPNNEIKVN